MESKILDFDFAVAAREVIEKYWETIGHYRSQGRSLSQIYIALSKRDGYEDRISFAAFKASYYRQRKLKCSGEAKRDPVTINEVVEITPPSRKSMKSGKISKPSGEFQSPVLSEIRDQAEPLIVKDVVVSTLDESSPDSSAQEPKNRVFKSESTSSENVEQKPINEETKPFARLELGGTLEQRRAIARAHFNQ